MRNPFAKDKPYRSKRYLGWAKDRYRECANCGAQAEELHHFGPRGLGQKASDLFVVPICRRCHDIIHSRGISLLVVGTDETTDEVLMRMLGAQREMLARFVAEECVCRDGSDVCEEGGR